MVKPGVKVEVAMQAEDSNEEYREESWPALANIWTVHYLKLATIMKDFK